MKILIVDGLNIAMRRFYAMGGQEVIDNEKDAGRAIKFLNEVAQTSLVAIENRASFGKFDEVRVAFESEQECWRYAEYEDYKYAVSEPDRPRVGAAVQTYLAKALKRAGITPLQAPYMEADDVIATMVETARGMLFTDKKARIAIWSNDQDLWQVLDPSQSQITVLIEGTQKDGDIQEIDGKDVIDRLEIQPHAIPLYKALVGDKSDNLPGIDGVGPKTAAKLIRSAPRREPVPFVVDPELAGPKLASLILSKEVQINRDMRIAYLRRDAKLKRVL